MASASDYLETRILDFFLKNNSLSTSAPNTIYLDFIECKYRKQNNREDFISMALFRRELKEREEEKKKEMEKLLNNQKKVRQQTKNF